MNETTTLVFLIAIILFAAFEQTISGFGFSLIVMPFATLLVGLRIAAPLVALMGLSLYTINLLRYRHALDLRETRRLGMAAVLGVPLGVWGLVHLDESLVKFFLGLVLIAYALFAWARITPHLVLSSRWAYLAGLASGCLGGAYNTPGPPLIVYGTLRHWQREEFRAVLQALFFTTGLLTVIAHFFAHHYTLAIVTHYLFGLPALGIGIWSASRVDRHIDHVAFRRIVLLMIFVLGITLI